MISSDAELVIYNAAIHTLVDGQPRYSAMAVRNGRIVVLGDDAEILALAAPQADRVDLAGHMVMPGIIDGHLHILQGAEDDQYNLRLTADMDFDAILSKVAAAANENRDRDWIVGGRFGSAALAAMQQPGALARLDAVSMGRPVLLEHVSAHARFANSAALQAADLTDETPPPELGSFGKDADGRLNGVLNEMAAWPAIHAITPFTNCQTVDISWHGVSILNRYGITGFLDAFSTGRTLRAFKALDDAGSLNAWAGFCLGLNGTWESGDPDHDPAQLEKEHGTFAGERIRTSFAKIFLDGVPSLRTAAMLAPYATDGAEAPITDGGATILDQAALTAEIKRYDRMGLTTKVHAIGDRAVRMVLDAVQDVRAANGPDGPAHQIAHMNLIAPEDVSRLADLNVTADLCPPLWYPGAASDGHARAVGPKRYTSAWPIRDIVASGARAMAGSDWPTLFATPDPWPGLAGMVTRRSTDPAFAQAQSPKQAIDLETALHLYTRNPARAMGISNETGTLEVGKSADFIVLDRNLFDIPPAEIAATRVLATLFQGRVVHGDLTVAANSEASR